MTRRWRSALALAALAAVALGVAACGDSEPDQRKAFIAFLQTRILDRPGVRTPNPSDVDRKAFGPYAAHYDVMTSFTGDSDLIAMTKEMAQALPNVRSLPAVVENREAIKTAGERFGKTLQTMEEKLARTNAARAALQQPDDLKTVYDATYKRIVTAPADGFREAGPIMLEILAVAVKIGDYVAANPAKVKIIGGSLQPADRKTETELNALLQEMNRHAPRFNDAHRRLRIVLQGS